MLGTFKRVVIVTGSRNLEDFKAVHKQLRIHDPDLVINGGATGADAAARAWCQHNSVPSLTVYADWDTYGRAAGPIRNGKMLDVCSTAVVLAFPASESRGTRDCVKQAREKGMLVEVVEESK